MHTQVAKRCCGTHYSSVLGLVPVYHSLTTSIGLMMACALIANRAYLPSSNLEGEALVKTTSEMDGS